MQNHEAYIDNIRQTFSISQQTAMWIHAELIYGPINNGDLFCDPGYVERHKVDVSQRPFTAEFILELGYVYDQIIALCQLMGHESACEELFKLFDR